MCLGRKSPTIFNLHLDNWPVCLTTTTVVLNVLRKRSSFRALSIDKNCSRLRQSQAKQIQRVVEVFATNEKWSLPNRNNLQQKQYSPHSNFDYNNQDLKILSPFLSVLQNHFIRKTFSQFLRAITNWWRYQKDHCFDTYLGLLWLIQLSSYALSLSHQAERFRGWHSAFPP